MARCLGNLNGHRPRGRVDPLGLVAIGVALAIRAAFIESCPQKTLALDLHRQFEGPGEDAGQVARAVLDQMFQDRLNCRIFVPVHSCCSMVVC